MTRQANKSDRRNSLMKWKQGKSGMNDILMKKLILEHTKDDQQDDSHFVFGFILRHSDSLTSFYLHSLT